jgi:hypothetical protein
MGSGQLDDRIEWMGMYVHYPQKTDSRCDQGQQAGVEED